jgi:hypothetical protein
LCPASARFLALANIVSKWSPSVAIVPLGIICYSIRYLFSAI